MEKAFEFILDNWLAITNIITALIGLVVYMRGKSREEMAKAAGHAVTTVAVELGGVAAKIPEEKLHHEVGVMYDITTVALLGKFPGLSWFFQKYFTHEKAEDAVVKAWRHWIALTAAPKPPAPQ